MAKLSEFRIKEEVLPLHAVQMLAVGKKALENFLDLVNEKLSKNFSCSYTVSTDALVIFEGGQKVFTASIADFICVSNKGTIFPMERDPFNATFEEIDGE